MLGEQQREWLIETLTTDDSYWTVWADEVVTIPFRLGSGSLSVYPGQGGWDGYTRERQRISEAVAAADVDNYVTISGDMHCYIAGYKQASYPGRVTGGEGVAYGERIGVEFMTPATTSLNVAEALHLTCGLRSRITEPLVSWLIETMNPHIDFFDSHNWGYSVLEFDRELVATYRVPEGSVELNDVSDRYR